MSALLHQTWQELTVPQIFVHLSNAKSYINIVTDFSQPFKRKKKTTEQAKVCGLTERK